MALSANTVLEVRLTGSDTNGGGFVTGAAGTDWSQQDAAQYSVTDGVTAGTTTITSATANFGTDVVGNLIYVQGGTGAVVAGWYEITARGSATSITVDRATGLTAGTGVTLKIGGALLSPAIASAIAAVSFMTVFIKYNATAYAITTASTNVAGGCINNGNNVAFVGYDTTRSPYNRDANRPTLRLGAGVTAATIFGNVNATYLLSSVILDGNSQTGSKCYNSSGNLFFVKAMNGVSAGFQQNSNTAIAILCEATLCAATPFNILNCFYCTAHDNTLTSPTNAAVFAGNSGTMYGCIAYNNNCNGFGGSLLVSNCVAYGNSLQGFDAVNNNQTTFVNCIAENNAAWGFRTNTAYMAMINCASYNNTSGRFQNGGGKLYSDLNPITGSGSFFTNAAGLDFTLNNTAGAGALLRATGFPTSFPVPAMNNYHDIGALQHQDAGGTSGPVAQFKLFGRGAPY